MVNLKKAFLYFDDDPATIETFRDTVRRAWCLNYDVISNQTFGPITKEMYDDFEKEILTKVSENYERIECIFLDIDFGSGPTPPDTTGLLLGRELRRRWPDLPIILASRFAETELYKKGMIFDFDYLCDPTELFQMDVNEFIGMIGLTKEKRSNFLSSIGDIPVSYKLV